MDTPSSISLAELRDKIAPVTLAGQQQLPVPEALAGLFPVGGLPTGWSVGVSGSAGWTVAARLVASVVEAHRWVAFVGAEEFGLVAAQEQGVPLDRTLLVTHPEPQQWATVLAVLAEAVGVICINPTCPIGRRDARRLSARLREQKGVLIHLDGGRHWPEPLDAQIVAEGGRWEGLGRGHGVLRQRSMTLSAQGRRSMAQPRRAVVV